MQNLVHQIGELFLRAVPIALIVMIFYVVLRALFFRPILKVMAEREARSTGAQKAAEAAQAAAAEKMKQYQEALKQAKAKVAQDEAQLKFDEAEYERYVRLAATGAAARSDPASASRTLWGRMRPAAWR